MNVMSCSLESLSTLLEHSHLLVSGTDIASIIQSQCKPLKYLGKLINKDHCPWSHLVQAAGRGGGAASPPPPASTPKN